MYVLQNLHWFVIFISALVFFHELGHFLVAKACGVKVLKFSIGFGPRLFGFRRGETEYAVGALPLGGFVKMLGEVPGSEQEIPPEDAPRAFNNRPVWQRSAIVLAGPVFNFALALVVYFFMFTGVQSFGDTKLGIVNPGEPAWNAGLRPGDRVVAIDGEPVTQWNELRERIGARPGETVAVTFERGDERRTVHLSTAARDEANVFQETETRGKIGVSLQYLKPIIAVIDPDSPAARAGAQSGDVIEKVNGEPIEAWHEVRAALREVRPGEPIQLGLRRGERSIDASFVAEPPVEGLDPELFSSADTLHGYTGLVNKESVVVSVEPDTPAAEIGLAPGDRLLRLGVRRDGELIEKPIGVWAVDLVNGVDAREQFVLTYQRGREVRSAELQLAQREERDEFQNVQTRHVFGAKNDPEMLGTYVVERNVGPMEAAGEATLQVGEDMTLIAKGLGKLVQGDIPLDSMGGPIMLFVIAEKSAKRGFADFLRMMAVISVNLGLVNLLPIPVLDGGHLMFLGLEAVRRRPPSLRVREVANFVGLAILLLLMVLVFKNDLFRFVLG